MDLERDLLQVCSAMQGLSPRLAQIAENSANTELNHIGNTIDILAERIGQLSEKASSL